MKKVTVFLIFGSLLLACRTQKSSLLAEDGRLMLGGVPFTGTREQIAKIVSPDKPCPCDSFSKSKSIVVLERSLKRPTQTDSVGYAIFVQNKPGYYWKQIDFIPYPAKISSLERVEYKKITLVLGQDTVQYVLTSRGRWKKTSK
ncbi:MAG TPA: hypothetical protein VLB02_00900 [Candidatus Paceibacterota bacterium]|nr:hypothetical protein [Candidatus Paceibacterota bacterium]